MDLAEKNTSEKNEYKTKSNYFFKKNQIMEWYYLLLVAEIEGVDKVYSRQLTSMVIVLR